MQLSQIGRVVVVGMARTAIGTFGGSLKDVPNTQLATTVARAALQRSGVNPDAVGVAALDAGCPQTTPAYSVNRLCGSGLQAIISAAQAIALGDCELAIGGGSESMSRAPYFSMSARFGSRMGDGPVPATQNALERTGLKISDIDVIEANEAFAAQACAVTQELGLDSAKVNPNGSGISLGHPIGATGAIIVVKAIAELHRTQGRYALVTMCIGGGQGIAAIFER